MNKTTSILFGFAFMAFLCLQATAIPFLQNHSMKNSIITAIAGSSGVVDIKTDTNSSRGFYVEADLNYYPSSLEEKPNGTSFNSVFVTRMMISIANNGTMLASNCLGFWSFNCTQYKCHYQPGQREISYPTFIASTVPAQNDIYLDHAYWTLTSTPFYLAQECQTGDTTSGIGKLRSGVLGLGTAGEAANDFKLSQKFAIYINPNLTSGKLLFNGDTSFAKSSNPMFTLEANSTWNVDIWSGSVVTSTGAAGFNGDLMFDINSDAIGLPYYTYTLFLQYFSKNPGVSCSTELSKPLCSIRDVQLLSDITIQFDGNTIRIPPKIYATPAAGYDSSYFFLNFKATSPTLDRNNYVTPAFQKAIILDSNFMSYYFTVFDATSGTNKIYIYEAGSRDALSGDIPWVGMGAIVVVFLAIIGCCAKNKGSVNKSTSTVVTNTTQQPLVYNYPAYSAQPQGGYLTPTYQNGYQQPQGAVYHN